jgi:streptogramin lyase
MQLDQQGNPWTVDSGTPPRIVKLDPRTMEQMSFDLPDPTAGVHEILIDRQGLIWVPEFRNVGQSRLLAFNTRTQRWDQTLDTDPNHEVGHETGPLMGSTLDSKGNIYMNLVMTGAIAKWDRAANKMSVFHIPTPNATPYGQAIDSRDNVWITLWNGGKLAKFDTSVNQWSEYTPPSYPGNMRRGVGVDSADNVWVGIWAAGKRPGKIAKFDQKTGRWTEWDVPHYGAQPYEASADKDDNIWFPDTGTPDRAALLARFNPRTQAFTFYPKPQFVADTSKLQHAADGSVWYVPRHGSAMGTSGFGVLYPDMNKITALTAMPLNGSPGYPFKILPTR